MGKSHGGKSILVNVVIIISVQDITAWVWVTSMSGCVKSSSCAGHRFDLRCKIRSQGKSQAELDWNSFAKNKKQKKNNKVHKGFQLHCVVHLPKPKQMKKTIPGYSFWHFSQKLTDHKNYNFNWKKIFLLTK